MKLKNKKTGEIVIAYVTHIVSGVRFDCGQSLAELNEEWEDYEEPKVGFIIEPMEEDCVSADDSGYEESDVERAKELGLWFETEGEAERAVEKLKAYKRLKDKGFRFKFLKNNSIVFDAGEGIDDQYVDDMNLLFGGEE